MDENYTNLAVHIQEVDSRSRSNEHRLDDHDDELRELREKQDAIYDLTSSVKSIATDMTYIKEDVTEVKSEKLLWLVIGGLTVSLLTTILPNIPW